MRALLFHRLFLNRNWFGIDFLTGTHFQQTIHDHSFAGGQALADHLHSGVQCAEFHGTEGCYVVLADNHNQFLPLHADHRALRHKHGLIAGANQYAQTNTYLPREHTLLEITYASHTSRAPLAIYSIIQKVDVTRVEKILLVLQRKLNRHLHFVLVTGKNFFERVVITDVAQQRTLIYVRIGIDRVHRDDRRQRFFSLRRNQVAHGDIGETRVAIDWRSDPAKFQVKSGTFQCGASRQKRALGLQEGGAGFVKISGGRRSLFAKLFGPIVVRGRQFQGRVRLIVFALGAILVGLIGARIDYEQDLSLLDHIAVLELHFREIAADFRANLNRAQGREATRVFIPIFHLTLFGCGHGDHRRRQFDRLFFFSATGK